MSGNKKKQMIAGIVSIVLCAVMICGIVFSGKKPGDSYVYIDDENTPLGSNGILIKETAADTSVIPDKYNTGCNGNLSKVDISKTLNGLVLKGTTDRVVLEFAYKNTKVSGEVVIDSVDFSDGAFAIQHEGKVDRDITVVFNNCKFGKFSTGREPGRIKFVFNNCSFVQFFGSAATFNRCHFGHSFYDCLVPFQDVCVNDSYFCDLATSDPAGVGKHSDGTQMYGYSGVPVKDVSFNRCRMEIPAVQSETKNRASVNACLMVQLEYASAYNVQFNDCIINGGGYSIYAHAVKDPANKLNDVLFNNVAIGSAKLFGNIYPDISDGVEFINVHDQDSLYVSSVWKDEKGTHVIVSNDTNIDRTLKIVTNNQEYQFTIEKCLGGKDLRYNNFDISFSAFPFDKEIVISGDVDYIVCFDDTDSEKQVRFVNWTEKDVYISSSVNADDSETINYDKEGKYGDNISYEIKDGILYISGTGEVKRLGNVTPWDQYKNEIVAVWVNDGITSISANSFMGLEQLEEVALPVTVNYIDEGAFSDCTKLQGIIFYNGVKQIAKGAFNNTDLKGCFFYGTPEEWNSISVSEQNDKLLSCKVLYFASDNSVLGDNESADKADGTEQNAENIEEVILSGECGKNVSFELTNAGNMRIWGEGDMYSYNSAKLPPWNEYLESIVSVTIEEGVTSVGFMSFRKATSLQSVLLPQSLKIINGNSFRGCRALTSIVLYDQVEQICKGAFYGSGIKEAVYLGSENQWGSISVGEENEPLTSNISFVK